MNLHLPLRFAVILFLLLVSVSPTFSQTDDATLPYEFERYNDHLVRIAVSDPVAVNIFASIGPDGVLIVDTGLPQSAAVFQQALAELTDLPVEIALLTHTHLDHTGGLPVFAADALLMVHKAGVLNDYFSLEPLRQFPNPTVAIAKPTTIHFNGEDIHLVPLKPGHSNDEMIIHFVDSGIICVGSRILPSSFPFVDLSKGGDLDEVFARIEKLATENPECRFASSHGPTLTAQEALDYRTDMMKKVAEITQAQSEGKTAEELVAEGYAMTWGGTIISEAAQLAWVRQLVAIKSMTAEAKPDVAAPFTEELMRKDVKAAIKLYKKLKKKEADEWSFAENQINMLGYQLMYRDRLDDALKVLKLNMNEHPKSANVYDSYGEVLLAKGDTTAAIKQYEKALEVNPEWVNATNVLERIRQQ